MRPQGLSKVLTLIIVMVCFYFMPYMFMPKRWTDIQKGNERTVVHTILGVPDVDYSVKGFDGWHNPFYVGAVVLIVHYDMNRSKVVDTEIKITWGTGYLDWAQDYKKLLDK